MVYFDKQKHKCPSLSFSENYSTQARQLILAKELEGNGYVMCKDLESFALFTSSEGILRRIKELVSADSTGYEKKEGFVHLLLTQLSVF